MLLAGCQAGGPWPRDTGSTLDDVRGGLLRVGVTESPPWTVVAGGAGTPKVTGAEPRLVERLAERLGARVEWHVGSESTLMAALADRVLHLVIGGLAADAPWTEHASLTRPYLTMRTVVAVPPGVPAPEELAGVRVAVLAGTAEVAALGARDAVAVPVAELPGAQRLAAAVPEWRLAELGLRGTDHELAKQEHVWALPLGENAWQVEVERFLLATPRDEVERLLVEAQRSLAVAR
jgi:polar amino acid transport system substrate-binding protein